MNDFEIRKMVEFVQTMDIGKNPEPAAIFDPLIQGFNIWAIPSDHPGGEWDRVIDAMDAGAYTKRSAFVGTAFYNRAENIIELSTDAYLLKHPKIDLSLKEYKEIHNRPEDIVWCIEKILWVFRQIGISCPEIVVRDK